MVFLGEQRVGIDPASSAKGASLFCYYYRTTCTTSPHHVAEREGWGWLELKIFPVQAISPLLRRELNSFHLTPGKFKALNIFHFQLQLILQVPKFKSLWYQTAEGSRLQWCFPHNFYHIFQHFLINHAVFILLRHFHKITENALVFFHANLRTTFATFISMEGMAVEELNNWLSIKFEIHIVHVGQSNYPLNKYQWSKGKCIILHTEGHLKGEDMDG